jgi:hypothetical protein
MYDRLDLGEGARQRYFVSVIEGVVSLFGDGWI